MNRRDWLKTAGGLVVGFTFSGVPAFGGQAGPAGPLGRRREVARSERGRQLSLDPPGRLGHGLHEQSGRRDRHAHRDGADGGRRARRGHRADHRRRRRHGAMSEHRRHGRQHGADTRRHRRSSGGGDRPPGAPRSRGDAVEAPGRRPRRLSRAKCAPLQAVAAYPSATWSAARRLDAASGREGTARPSVAVREGWTVTAAARGPCQVHGPLSVHPGLQRSRHAPRPRDPAASCSAQRSSRSTRPPSRSFPAFA